MKRVAGALLLLGVFACTASAAGPVRVSLAGKRAAPVVGRAWTVRLAVRPRIVRGSGSRERGRARAGPRPRDRPARGSYRARLVFPRPGLWRISAQAGGATSRLGSVRVRTAHRRGPSSSPSRPRSTSSPPARLLLVENNPGRVLRVNPATGHVSVLVPAHRPAVRDRPRSVGQRLSLGRKPAAAVERRPGRRRPSPRCPPESRSGRSRPRRTATSTTRPRRRSSGSREVQGRRSGSPAPGRQVEAVTAVRP